jgi:hypothetical protein
MQSRRERYSALMRNLRILASLAAMLFLASNALSQTADSHPATTHEVPPQVAIARCAYTHTDDVCSSASENTRLAQMPRRMPGPPLRGRPPMRGPGYPGMWPSMPSARHALIGAVIGGLAGWAVAAKSNSGARATVALGFIGAGIGAGIGFSLPDLPSRYQYRRRWPDNDEDAAARKSAKPGPKPSASSQQTASSIPQPSNPLPEADDRVSLAVSAP